MRTTKSYFILVALCGAPLSGCASDHLLGDMPQPDLQDANEAGQTAAGRQDFLASAELGPPDLMLEWNRNASFGPMGATSVGDFDGDGFEDFATYDTFATSGLHIRYGRPRPERTAD